MRIYNGPAAFKRERPGPSRTSENRLNQVGGIRLQTVHVPSVHSRKQPLRPTVAILGQLVQRVLTRPSGDDLPGRGVTRDGGGRTRRQGEGRRRSGSWVMSQPVAARLRRERPEQTTRFSRRIKSRNVATSAGPGESLEKRVRWLWCAGKTANAKFSAKPTCGGSWSAYWHAGHKVPVELHHPRQAVTAGSRGSSSPIKSRPRRVSVSL
jgi:hypothetical protein